MAAKASGNDKATWLILALLAELAVLFCAVGFVLALGGGKRAGWLKPLCLGSFLPLVYTGVVLILSRFDVIDSISWLGIR